MAAAGAAAKQGPWIARMWRMGWEKIPVVMVGHCLSTPFAVWFIIERVFLPEPDIPAEKYRTKYTVFRPGDPRIARINHHSSYDNLSPFSS